MSNDTKTPVEVLPVESVFGRQEGELFSLLVPSGPEGASSRYGKIYGYLERSETSDCHYWVRLSESIVSLARMNNRLEISSDEGAAVLSLGIVRNPIDGEKTIVATKSSGRTPRSNFWLMAARVALEIEKTTGLIEANVRINEVQSRPRLFRVVR